MASVSQSKWNETHRLRILDPTIYHKGKWQTQKLNVSQLPPTIANKLRICTYNIWFGNERQKLRMKHICDLMQNNAVDIFCFQEVTMSLLQHILSHPFLQEYYLSGITRDDIGSYGNVIFSRFPLSDAYIYDYTQTGMQRKLVCADILINNELFRIGTVHFESLPPGAAKRRSQLQESLQFMLDRHDSVNRPQHLMLMGDFNACAVTNAGSLPMTDKQFMSSWSTYYGEGMHNPGWTMPETEYFPPWKPDRLYFAFGYDYADIDKANKAKMEKEAAATSLDSSSDEEYKKDVLEETQTFVFPKNQTVEKKSKEFKYEMKGEKGEWALKWIKRVGMENIPFTEQEIIDKDRVTVMTPSDHYGLIAEFVLIGTEMDELKKSVKSVKI